MIEAITVSALNKYVRSILESDPVLTDIAISGEVSNFVRNHKTGHCYFSLKDAKASVKAVMFRTEAENLGFQPENGMRVVARGRISLYERDGAFQVYVEFMFPDGEGAVQIAFDQLKARLEAEGLFAPEHKQPLPEFPACVGLVTSKTGAALQDILKVAQRRCPAAEFLLVPVAVQGTGAAEQVCAAIAALDGAEDVDVIIVARGGGSAEDLWVFNAEAIARAAHACSTPLISAIGHETDFTILDYVADLRAPTPSAAAEMALPDLAHYYRNVVHIYTQIRNNIQLEIDSWYNDWKGMLRQCGTQGLSARLAGQREALRRTADTLRGRQHSRVQQAQTRLRAAAALAEGLSPYAVLARGYSVARTRGAVLRSVAQAQPGDPVDIQLADGMLGCTVNRVDSRTGE